MNFALLFDVPTGRLCKKKSIEKLVRPQFATGFQKAPFGRKTVRTPRSWQPEAKSQLKLPRCTYSSTLSGSFHELRTVVDIANCTVLSTCEFRAILLFKRHRCSFFPKKRAWMDYDFLHRHCFPFFQKQRSVPPGCLWNESVRLSPILRKRSVRLASAQKGRHRYFFYSCR